MRQFPIISFTVLLAASACAAQTSITLRPSAELPAGAQEVRVADIADLAGPEATALGSVVVQSVAERASGSGGTLRIDIASVRAALDAAPTGMVNWGRVTLKGASCAVELDELPKVAAEPAPRRVKETTTPGPIDMIGEPTVLTAIAARIALAHATTVDRLRLGFDPSDQPVLDAPLGDRRADIDFAASPGSARLPVTVTLYSGDRIDLHRTVQADVRVRQSVVKAAMAMERGRIIAAADLIAEDRWGPPTRVSLPSIEDLVGQLTSKRIAAGAELGHDDFAAPLACKRGDAVFVHCLSGSVVVKVRARALGAAREGELVELKLEGGGRDDKPFTARMSGKGRAVIDANR